MVSGAGDTEPETPDQRRCLLTSFPGVGAVAGGREVAAQYFLCAASVCWWQSVLPVRCHSHGIRSGFSTGNPSERHNTDSGSASAT